MARTTRAAAAKSQEKTAHQLSSPPATPAPTKKRARKTAAAVKTEDEGNGVNDLPHNLGTAMPSPDEEDAPPPKKRAKRTPVKKEATPKVEPQDAAIKNEDAPTPKKKTPKKANYGLTPGISPYPNYARPTPEECHEVVRLLSKLHGKPATRPATIPPPSLDVSGCGEVPSVLDALVRTRLSANTTNKNSSTAFQGLVKRFGTLKEGVGKGSVDWNAVRIAPQKEVFLAIERGGLADRKSKDIQAILNIAYEETQQREGRNAKDGVISLDHLHQLSTPDAIARMLELPGIGPKTASCVALFCLQRPSFAVDTHVFRLCQYLGWLPSPSSLKKGEAKISRESCYSHCDVRIPDEDKYALHQLLITHGKKCGRCRAVTGVSSAGWEDGCGIEHLVRRHGSKKGGVSAVAKKRAKAVAEGEEEGDGEGSGSDGSEEEED